MEQGLFHTLTIALVVTLTGCGILQPSPNAQARLPPAVSSPTASPAPSESPSGSPTSSGGESPMPTPTLAPTCEMPFVAASQRMYSTGDGSAGFLKLPEGSFRADPDGSITQALSGQYFVGRSPALPGAFFTGNRSWDVAAKRWLPVPAEQVAADSASYIYQVGPDEHLVMVGTGTDKVIYHQPSGMPPANWAGTQLLAYIDGSVYLSVHSTYGGEGGSVQSIPPDQVGVWRIDVAGGPPTRLLTFALDGLITNDGTKLWTIEDNNADPPTGSLVTYELKTAQATQWFSVPNSGMDLLGFDTNGNAIVWTYDYQGDLKIWIVSAPNAVVAIDSETYSGNVPFYSGNHLEFGSLVSDRHGTWFGSVNGLYLYDQSGLHKVAEESGIPVGQCS
ncbi:MAG: hypothetical protein WB682_01360 [Candidatus Dormiibacterota bacterium]